MQDDAVNGIKHLMKRLDQRLTLNNLRLSERYFKSELHLLIHFRIGGVNEEFVACFQREQAISRSEKNIGHRDIIGVTKPSFTPSLHHYSMHMWPDIDAPVSRSDSNQKAVFIDVVKLMETPKRIVPSAVWFDRVNCFYSVWPHTRYFSSATGFVSRGVIEDRKVCLRGRGTTANDNKIVGQMVEGAPKIVNQIPGDSGHSKGRLPNAEEIIDQFSSLRIMLGSDYIWVGHQERANFNLKITEVLFGPFNFYADCS